MKAKDLAAAGVERVARVAGVRDGLPVLRGRPRRSTSANVIWCTGFDPGFSWIDLPVLGADGEPIHDGGVVAGARRASTSSGCTSSMRCRRR